MGQLHSCQCVLPFDEMKYPREHFNVPIAPDPEIIRTDAALGQNGGRLRENKSGPADRATAEMNQVPIVRVAVLAGILTPWRDHDSISEAQLAQLQR